MALGGMQPLGLLELEHGAGIAAAIGVRLGWGRNAVQLAGELSRFDHHQQPAYSLMVQGIGLSYQYAVINRLSWQLRAGAGLGINRLVRQLRAAAEQGAVLAPHLTVGYVQNFGRPKFLLELTGTEFVELTGQTPRRLITATIAGFRFGFGYEL